MGEPEKLIYLDRKNPKEKVIGKHMIKLAICGVKAINPKSIICFWTKKL